jgi:predicted nucleic acid-binding protein
VIADTSGLLAYYNINEPAHEAVRNAIETSDGPLVISPFVIAELDYLLATRVSIDAELAVLTELSSGAYELPALACADLAACSAVIGKYRDQDVGVTDASLVVLAERYATRTILTLDRRHFQVLRPLQGKRFTLLP